MTSEVAPIRPGEELDTAALAEYLRGRIEGAEHGIRVQQFPGGHSNLTYLLSAGGREYVLRRPPLGPVAAKAHDMAREYNVLRAVHPVFPPAPAALLLCEDPAVIGATFYLMERRRGIILRDEAPAGLDPDAVSRGFLDCLADLHRIDIERHGLTSLGHPEGFLARQVRGWTDRWERAKTEDPPGMNTVMDWLAARLPVSGPPAMVHNDFKLDNVMLDPASPGRISAVLDWEMATAGDPLVDLGGTLCYWLEGGGLTTQAGWYSREQLIDRYAERTGRDLSVLAYYEVFGCFKLAVILQQIYFRWHRGQTRDERFRDFPSRVRALVQAALRTLERPG